MGQYFDNVDEDPLISADVNYSISSWDKGVDEDDESLTGTLKEYSRLIKMKYLFIVGCLVAIIVAISVSVTIGSYDIPFLKVYSLIFDHIMGTVSPDDSTADYVVWNLRLPRIITGIFGGAALAVAGAVMQSVLKNPLADSYTQE
jgi:iron complex transport system permease protein